MDYPPKLTKAITNKINLINGVITKHQRFSKNNTLKIKGYASVFGKVDNHNDIVAPGAFASTINKNTNEPGIKLLWQHEPSKPIGIVKLLKEDNYGLYIEAIINCETQQGREAATLIEQGTINSLSIGFTVNDFHLNEEGQRVLVDIELWEVSLVTFPANKHAKLLPSLVTPASTTITEEEKLLLIALTQAHCAFAHLKQIYYR